MKKNWFEEKIDKFSSLRGYQKPELISDAVKLDSNENYVITKQFQNDILTSARKNSDVREYPLVWSRTLNFSDIKICKNSFFNDRCR